MRSRRWIVVDEDCDLYCHNQFRQCPYRRGAAVLCRCRPASLSLREMKACSNEACPSRAVSVCLQMERTPLALARYEL